jgi:hypothetical protein
MQSTTNPSRAEGDARFRVQLRACMQLRLAKAESQLARLRSFFAEVERELDSSHLDVLTRVLKLLETVDGCTEAAVEIKLMTVWKGTGLFDAELLDCLRRVGAKMKADVSGRQ